MRCLTFPARRIDAEFVTRAGGGIIRQSNRLNLSFTSSTQHTAFAAIRRLEIMIQIHEAREDLAKRRDADEQIDKFFEDPPWLMLDLAPDGLGMDWYPKLDY